MIHNFFKLIVRSHILYIKSMNLLFQIIDTNLGVNITTRRIQYATLGKRNNSYFFFMFSMLFIIPTNISNLR